MFCLAGRLGRRGKGAGPFVQRGKLRISQTLFSRRFGPPLQKNARPQALPWPLRSSVCGELAGKAADVPAVRSAEVSFSPTRKNRPRPRISEAAMPAGGRKPASQFSRLANNRTVLVRLSFLYLP